MIIEKPESQKVGWQTKESTYLYKSKWFNLRSDKIKTDKDFEFTYTFVEHPGSVTVVPITESNEVILIRSFRYTTDRWTWELPAGGVGDQLGISIEEVAKAELREEVGGVADRIITLGTFDLANGIADMPMHICLASGVKINGAQALEFGEKIDQVKTVPLMEALRMVYAGEMRDGNSALALLLATNFLDTNR